MDRKIICLLIALLAVHLLFLLNLRFTAWPEMLLWPYLVIKGWLPYVNIAIAHTPLLIIKLAAFYKIFGVGILQLKIYTWLLIAVTDIAVYLVANKLWGRRVAVISLAAFAVWQLFFDGNGLWFDLILAPMAVLTFFLTETKHYFWVGVFWAFMLFTKQTAIWFLIPIGLAVIEEKRKFLEQIRGLVVGSVIVIALWAIALWLWKVLPAFYQWAINFGVFVLPKAQGQAQLPDLKALLVASLPYAIFVPLLFFKKKRDWNLLLWAFVGSLGAYPRFEYFHFQPSIPFLAFALGLVLSEVKNYRKLWKIFIILYLFGAIYLFAGFFMRNWDEGTRFYGQDVQDVSAFVVSQTKPDDKIFILNWWDNIYALTDTIPAVNPWVPQLSWYMDLPGIQDKILKDLEVEMPRLIIFSPYTESGLSAYIPKQVYSYVSSNYKLKEKIDGLEILVPKK